MHIIFWTIVALISTKADLPTVIWGSSCPDVSGMPNFDATNYTGRWFQLSSLPYIFISSVDSCVWANYTLLSNGNIGVENSAINWWTGIRFAVIGEAAPITNTPGVFNVEFSMQPSSTGESNYIVLDTDYDEFAYVWSCDDFFFFHIPKLWILNREHDRTLKYIVQQEDTALELLKDFGYSSENVVEVEESFDIIDQSDCDY